MPDDFGLPTTRLTLLEDVAGDDEERRRRAVEKLLECYLPGMRRYLAWRFRRSAVSTDDVLQDLVTDKLLQGQLARCYLDSDRKGFRVYLKRALYNRAIDELRASPQPERDEEIEEQPAGLDLFEASITAEELRFLLSNVFRRVRDHYLGRGRQRYWDAFFRLYLQPLITGTKKPAYDTIVRELDFHNKDEAYDAVTNVRRQFDGTWAKVLQEQLGTTNPEIIDDELREIGRCASLFKDINLPDLLAGLPASKTQDALDLRTVSAARLSDLFDFAINRGAPYTDTELRALYRSYASGSLLSLFEQLVTEPPKSLRDTCSDYDPLVESIDRLLAHPHPPLALLVDLKRLARQILKSNVASVPKQIALSWRFLALGLALTRCGQNAESVSKLSQEELRRGFERMLEYPWIDADCRAVFQKAIASLSRVKEN